MTTATASPWVIVSAEFHEQAGQAKPNAALADFLLARGTPVHLVCHAAAERFREHPLCTIHDVRRPAGISLLGEFRIRKIGRRVAREITERFPGARVVANGGNCSWNDVNWVHFVHAAWTPSRASMPFVSRAKDALATAVFRRQEREAIGMAKLVIADSELTRQDAVRCLDLDPARTRAIYYGCESHWTPATPAERTAARQWLGVASDRKLAVFVGGFGYDERKGFDTLFEAWRQLCREPAWDVDLIAAGGGRTLDVWRRRIAAAGLESRIRLLGFTDRVYDLLAAADLLVSPTRYEPYGLNVQEAICRGVPALVSGRAGVAGQYPPELFDMILPDPGDWADLATRLRAWRGRIAAWPVAFIGLGQMLRSRTWPQMAADIVEAAESVLVQ